MVEMRIGIIDTAKEISLEIEQNQEELKTTIEGALTESAGMVWLSDRKGRQVGIPASKVAYVEIDPETSARSVGFTP